MTLDALYEKLEQYALNHSIALIGVDEKYSYEQLVKRIQFFRHKLNCNHPNSYCIIMYGDYGLDSIAFLWAALLEHRIIMPITNASVLDDQLQKVINADLEVRIKGLLFRELQNGKDKGTITEAIQNKLSGLVLLSSGTTGEPKAILHDADRLLKKYLYSKKPYITLALMLFDHIAGMDTMFYVLSAGGTLVLAPDRQIESLLKVLKTHSIEVLPASPSMIQFLLMDDRFSEESLPALRIITFGSERITDDLLRRLQVRFPNKVDIIQKYGITELGNPATITNKQDPRFIRFVPGKLEYKIIDDILHIKTESSMLAYLYEDGEEPFNGWYNTRDKVLQDGEWLRILGRETDIINVGGQKVYPAEIESIIQQMDSVIDVVVYGKKNDIMGSIVAARVSLKTDESLASFKTRMRKHCKNRLETFKIPAFVEIVEELEINQRFKKVRR